MPTPGAFQEALQSPATAFADADLRACEPDADMLGLPRAVTGAFAAVFRLRGASGDWAVKCFFADPAVVVSEQGRRYAALSKAVAAAPIEEVVPFEFQASGVRVDGRAHPILKMPWADGVPLGRFVEAHIAAPGVLRALAARWADVTARLEAAGIAHGDLQHGNVLARVDDAAPDAPADAPPAVRLALVDFDGARVPGLRARAAEAGHRNYAHPDRTAEDAGTHPDRFPTLVIYTALIALAERPGLWARFSTGENLLFSAPDLYEPASSALFDELDGIEAARPFARALRAACLLPQRATPSIPAVMRGETIEVPRSRRRVAGRRTWFEAAFLPAAALVAVLVGAGWVAGWPTLAVAAAFGADALAVGAVAAYARLETRAHARRLKREARRLGEEAEALGARTRALERDRAAVLGDVGRARAARLRELQETALYDRLKHHFIAEAAEAGGVAHRDIVRMKHAGIRTAWHATPGALRAVPEIGERARTSAARWRAALEARYAGAIPTALSESEEIRLERARLHRADDLARDLARVEERRGALGAEAARLAERLAQTRPYGPGAYLRFLLRAGPAPPAPEAPPPPPRPPSGAENAARTARDEEAPWWRGGGSGSEG